jgi:putative membrane-bound dehydrogenase-like protein
VRTHRCSLIILILFFWPSSFFAQAPTCTDSRLVIDLVAKEPEIVTPTGIAVDESGRIWIIENNTHERPANYRGATTDRIRVFSRFDGGSLPKQITTFAEGFKNSMGLTLGRDGAVYLVTRSEIYLLRDTKGSGVADERKVIVKLVTEATYPHNGLCGFAWDGLGNLYFGLGENRGADYQLVGTDGTTLSGGGEGGSIYRCRPDGTRLVRIATGFWNPFGLTFDAFGRLFAVDNDPDSRGPCRLMHIIQGGDYGYRYRNGRKGIHPFTAWNGELPGTLPMVAGTGEAPCGIVAYESTGLPAEYRGDLLVASWGDHVIERFRLTSRGASFISKAEPIVRGGEDFRPVGIATGPDGSLYVSDWVDKSYPVHGKGRIWRVRMKSPAFDDGLLPSQVSALSNTRLKSLLSHLKQEIRTAARETLVAKKDEGWKLLAEVIQDSQSKRAKMQALWAAGPHEGQYAALLLYLGVRDKTPEVRAEALRILGPRCLAIDTPTQRFREEDFLLKPALRDPSPLVQLNATLQLKSEASLGAMIPRLADKDPFLAGAALELLGRPENTGLLLPHVAALNPKLRVGILLALRRAACTEGRAKLPKFLADEDPEVRRAAIQWVGEEKLRDYATLAKASAFRPPVTRELFEAYLATLDFLSGRKRKPDDEPSGDQFIATILKDRSERPAIRSLALRMIRADHPALDANFLQQFLEDKDQATLRTAIRILAMKSDDASQEVLRRMAADLRAAPCLRAYAILGLAHSAANSSKTKQLLLELMHQPEWAGEARRSLRGTALSISVVEPTASLRPQRMDQWRSALDAKGNAEAGERVFFHPRGPRCFACHRVDGVGSTIGPDLSYIGRSSSREKLIESILTPSKEIAPQFTSWQVVTRDGKVRIGMIVEEGPNSTVTIADNQGSLEIIHRNQIEERHAVSTSIMPDNLQELMTVQEFRDLIAFLCERK